MSELILLVGIPGSGKSYYTLINFSGGPENRIISMDSIRHCLTGDASDQSRNGEVYTEFLYSLRIAASKLNEGSVEKLIIDNTNVRRKDRTKIIKEVRKKAPNCSVTIVYIRCALREALERNSKRSRVVPKEVIERMHETPMSNLPEASECDRLIIHDSI